MPDVGDELSAPVVPSQAYTEHYYRTACAGFEQWSETEGEGAAGIYPGILEIAKLRAGEHIVDIGTGRGELLAVAVERGAAHAIGIEYSEAGVTMARQTIARHGVDDRAEVVLADARQIPLETGIADLVTMVDVVEHLTPVELHRALLEARRLLRPGGRLVVHTAPNRNIYEITYRWLCRFWPGGRRWPSDPRNDWERMMHVNEQTQSSLRRALLNAGFPDPRVTLGSWVYTDMVPSERARRVYRGLARFGPTRRLGVGDLFAVSVR